MAIDVGFGVKIKRVKKKLSTSEVFKDFKIINTLNKKKWKKK